MVDELVGEGWCCWWWCGGFFDRFGCWWWCDCGDGWCSFILGGVVFRFEGGLVGFFVGCWVGLVGCGLVWCGWLVWCNVGGIGFVVVCYLGCCYEVEVEGVE